MGRVETQGLGAGDERVPEGQVEKLQNPAESRETGVGYRFREQEECGRVNPEQTRRSGSG